MNGSAGIWQALSAPCGDLGESCSGDVGSQVHCHVPASAHGHLVLLHADGRPSAATTTYGRAPPARHHDVFNQQHRTGTCRSGVRRRSSCSRACRGQQAAGDKAVAVRKKRSCDSHNEAAQPFELSLQLRQVLLWPHIGRVQACTDST